MTKIDFKTLIKVNNTLVQIQSKLALLSKFGLFLTFSIQFMTDFNNVWCYFTMPKKNFLED